MPIVVDPDLGSVLLPESNGGDSLVGSVVVLLPVEEDKLEDHQGDDYDQAHPSMRFLVSCMMVQVVCLVMKSISIERSIED